MLKKGLSVLLSLCMIATMGTIALAAGKVGTSLTGATYYDNGPITISPIVDAYGPLEYNADNKSLKETDSVQYGKTAYYLLLESGSDIIGDITMDDAIHGSTSADAISGMKVKGKWTTGSSYVDSTSIVRRKINSVDADSGLADFIDSTDTYYSFLAINVKNSTNTNSTNIIGTLTLNKSKAPTVVNLVLDIALVVYQSDGWINNDNSINVTEDYAGPLDEGILYTLTYDYDGDVLIDFVDGASMTVNVENQPANYIRFNTNEDESISELYPDANLSFWAGLGAFLSPIELFLPCDDPDSYIYQILEDGVLGKINGARYDDINNGFVFKPNKNRLGRYVISNVELSSFSQFSVDVISSSEVELNWGTVSGASKYVIQRAEEDIDDMKTAATVSAPAVSYTDSGLYSKTYYYYKVIAMSGSSVIAQTYVIDCKTPPSNSGAIETNYINLDAEKEYTLSYDYHGELEMTFDEGYGPMFWVNVKDQPDNVVYYDSKENPVIVKRNPNATMSFYNLKGNFIHVGELFIPTGFNPGYIYKINSDNTLSKIKDAEYDSYDEGWYLKTKTLGKYVVSDRALSTGSTSSGGGGGGGGGKPVTAAVATPTATTPLTAEQATAAFNTGLTAAKATGSAAVSTRVTNKDNIPLDVMQSVAQQAKNNGKTTTIHADTVDASGNILTRLYISPEKATKAVNVTARYDDTAVSAIRTMFNNHFKNKIAVMQLGYVGVLQPGQTRDIGMTVNVATKLSLAGMDTTKLRIYTYDPSTGYYYPVVTTYRIDTAGFLHFSINKSGYVIVSEGPLEKK